MATWSAGVEKLRPLINELGAGLPADFLLAWIQHESGGRPCAVGMCADGKGAICSENNTPASGCTGCGTPSATHVVEAGLFQLYFRKPDDRNYGTTSRELRVMCKGTSSTANRAATTAELREHIRAGLVMVRAEVDKARTALASVGATWSEGSSDFWQLVKLRHALPVYFKFLPAFKAANGGAPSSWREWREWVEDLSSGEFIAIAPEARSWSSAFQRNRIFDNAEKTGQYGGAELVQSTGNLATQLAGAGAALVVGAIAGAATKGGTMK